MLYWIIKLEWSQTDSEFVIVKAATKKQAIAKFKYDRGPKYVSCYGFTDKIR
jgi:hypothetical protein